MHVGEVFMTRPRSLITRDLAGIMPAAVKALLEKLEPMALMEEDGLKKGMLALSILSEKVHNEANTPAAIADAEGVMILLQTALLHPEPALREGATAIVAACVTSNDTKFLEASLAKSLPIALGRLCAEQDRKVKPTDAVKSGEPPQAVDPDLPTRRVAVRLLEHILLAAEPSFAAQVLAERTIASTPFKLLVNSDADIRRHAATMLRALLDNGTSERRVDIAPLLAFVSDEPDKVAEPCIQALSDEDAEISGTAVRALLAFRESTPLRDILMENKAVVMEALDGVKERVGEAASVMEWLQ